MLVNVTEYVLFARRTDRTPYEAMRRYQVLIIPDSVNKVPARCAHLHLVPINVLQRQVVRKDHLAERAFGVHVLFSQVEPHPRLRLPISTDCTPLGLIMTLPQVLSHGIGRLDDGTERTRFILVVGL